MTATPYNIVLPPKRKPTHSNGTYRKRNDEVHRAKVRKLRASWGNVGHVGARRDDRP